MRALQRSAYKPLLLGSLLRKFFNGFFPCAPPLLGFFGGLAIRELSRGAACAPAPGGSPGGSRQAGWQRGGCAVPDAS